jgi:DNA polymerase-3 subunit delta
LLTGEEAVLRNRALQEILREAKVEKDDFDLEIFDADGSPPSNWLASCGTAPFLADRRTVIIRHFLRLDTTIPNSKPSRPTIDPESLAALPESSLLILIGDTEADEDKASARAKKWESLVKKAGGFVESWDGVTKQSEKLLRDEVAAMGLKISPRAGQVLLEMVGGSFSRASEELEKLALICENGEIRESDVKCTVVPSQEFGVFVLTDAALGGDVGTALRQLKYLIGSGKKAEETAFAMILPQISRTLRLAFQARSLLDAGGHANKVPPDFELRLPERNNLLKEKEFVRNKAFALAARTTLPRLALSIEIVSKTDAILKGMGASYSGQDTLERMVLQLAAARSSA